MDLEDADWADAGRYVVWSRAAQAFAQTVAQRGGQAPFTKSRVISFIAYLKLLRASLRWCRFFCFKPNAVAV
jgi:hypothetical protein